MSLVCLEDTGGVSCCNQSRALFNAEFDEYKTPFSFPGPFPYRSWGGGVGKGPGNEDDKTLDNLCLFVCLFVFSVSALRSRTSFVVFHSKTGTLFVWHGSQTPDETADTALDSAKQLRKW